MKSCWGKNMPSQILKFAIFFKKEEKAAVLQFLGGAGEAANVHLQPRNNNVRSRRAATEESRWVFPPELN